MARFAPENPSIDALQQAYPLSESARQVINMARSAISGVLSGQDPGLVAIVGPCAMTEDRTTIDQEGDRLHALNVPEAGLFALHRQPVWKPRTDPEKWHGLETTNPRAAYKTVVERATATANVASEIGHGDHLRRYGHALTLGWLGSRNAEDMELVEAVIAHDATLPIGVKNGMSGSIDRALENVGRITQMRGSDAGATNLIFRGGDTLRTPQDWEHAYRNALERTDGRLIVDTAHGGEMAHHPNNVYEKSEEGQIECIEHILRIAEEEGELPAGIMIEASSAVSPTDPVISFDEALDGVARLQAIRQERAQ